LSEDLTLSEIMEHSHKSGSKLSLLIGNGLLYSHPCPEISNVLNVKEQSQFLEKVFEKCKNIAVNHPELILEEVRIALMTHFLDFYINNFPEKMTDFFKKYNYSCHNFLRKFKNIFTTNYDPLIYWSCLQDVKLFDDGIFGELPHSIDEIEQALREMSYKIPLYYLHGAYHFYYIMKEDQQYVIKKSTSGMRDLSKYLREYVDNRKNNPDQKPLIVMEDRDFIKKELIQNNAYLEFCFRQFTKIEGQLLVYGLSFETDQHLLQAICENKKLDTVYITYRQKGKKDKLRKALPKNTTNVFFIKIENERDGQLIWSPI